MMTNARFAQSLLRLARHISGWAGDMLDSPHGEAADPGTVARCASEVRSRLDFIESVGRAGEAPERQELRTLIDWLRVEAQIARHGAPVTDPAALEQAADALERLLAAPGGNVVPLQRPAS